MNSEGLESALILDTQSRVVHCSPAATALIGQHADSMANQPVKIVFPGLPLSPHTPGYNIAYAAIHGAQGHWALQWAQTAVGARIGLQVLLTHMRLDGALFIAVLLRADQSQLQHLVSTRQMTLADLSATR